MPHAGHLATTAAIALIGVALGVPPSAAADQFDFDKAHTEILFSYSHLGNSRAYGNFRDFDGTIVFDREGGFRLQAQRC